MNLNFVKRIWYAHNLGNQISVLNTTIFKISKEVLECNRTPYNHVNLKFNIKWLEFKSLLINEKILLTQKGILWKIVYFVYNGSNEEKALL